MVRRHVGAHSGLQNERTASAGEAKEVEKGRYSDVWRKDTLGGEEAAEVEAVAGW